MQDIDNIISKYSPQMAAYFSAALEDVENEILPLQVQLEPLLKKREELKGILNALGVDKEAVETEELRRYIKIQSDTLRTLNTFNNDYDPKWSSLDKAIYLTKNHGFLTLSKIADIIMEYEPQRNKEALRNNLSVVFSQDAIKPESEQKLNRRKNDKNKWEYKAK